MKKETGAQLRELASDRGEALRALEGAKQAAEHRQHQLQASLKGNTWFRMQLRIVYRHHASTARAVQLAPLLMLSPPASVLCPCPVPLQSHLLSQDLTSQPGSLSCPALVHDLATIADGLKLLEVHVSAVSHGPSHFACCTTSAA